MNKEEDLDLNCLTQSSRNISRTPKNAAFQNLMKAKIYIYIYLEYIYIMEYIYRETSFPALFSLLFLSCIFFYAYLLCICI